jgi:hypothetical protein
MYFIPILSTGDVRLLKIQSQIIEINKKTEPVFLNVYGAPESIPRNEFRQPM